MDHTARKPKVRLETMAEMNPVQLNVRSEAEASATPACRHTSESDAGLQATGRFETVMDLTLEC